MSSGYSSDPTLPLTPRMVEVLAAAAAGERMKQTATRLGVSCETVKDLRAAARARLAAPTFTAAACKAVRDGLL